MRTAAVLSTVLLALWSSSTALAQGYQIKWHSVNSGGGLVAGGSHKLNSSVGQPAAGFVQSIDYLHWVGFWAGEVPEPAVAPTVAAAKLLPDGTFVSISGKIAASSEIDFDSFFYIEEADRTCGIRVAVPGGPIAELVRGNVVNVIGTLGTTDAGERQLTGPMVLIVGSDAPLLPLAMPSFAVGGSDFGVPPVGQYGVTDGFGLNNVGLLIATWGRVTDAGTGYIVVDDGSQTLVTVDTATLTSPPNVDDYVTVIGISSLYQSAPGADRLRFVLPRTDQDIATH